MEKNETLFKKIKSIKIFHPRKSVIDHLLAYSKSIEMVDTPMGKVFSYSNN